MDKAFYAMMSRLRWINRWSLMRNTQTENVMEHSYQVAILAHALYLIKKKLIAEGMKGFLPDLAEVLAQALYHDASEIITGDMPTPIKYQTKELRQAYALVESKAVDRLVGMLPPDLRLEYEQILNPDTNDLAVKEACKLVKAADALSAYLKCLEELALDNKEFSEAAEQTKAKIKAMNMPELDYFMAEFSPSFSMSLDDLQR